MNSRTRHAIRTLGLALTTTLFIAAATSTSVQAVEAPAAEQKMAQQPIDELQKLPEIVVRAKKLAAVITDSEDEFFRLYDKLNKKYDYEIHCGYASLNRGSLIQTRVCAPNFIADNMVTVDYPVAGMGSSGSCVPASAYGPGAISGYCSPSMATAAVSFTSQRIERVPVELLIRERSKDYVQNMVDVINSDAVLRSKYDHLVGLYHEIESVQQRYVLVKAATWKPAKPNLGPRAG